MLQYSELNYACDIVKYIFIVSLEVHIYLTIYYSCDKYFYFLF